MVREAFHSENNQARASSRAWKIFRLKGEGLCKVLDQFDKTGVKILRGKDCRESLLTFCTKSCRFAREIQQSIRGYKREIGL